MTTNTDILAKSPAHTWWWYGLLLLATIGILTVYHDVLDVYEVSILILQQSVWPWWVINGRGFEIIRLPLLFSV